MTTAEAPARRSRDRLLRPTLPELWTFLAVALPVLGALIATLPTVDLAYQLRAGAAILAGDGIPATDTWTFTAAGAPWLDQQWGAQVVLAAIFGVTGWTGLAVVRAALVALVFGLTLVAIRRRAPGIGPRTAALLTIAAFIVASPALALRPQLLGVACFVATIALLAVRRAQPRAIWLVPIVAIAWANLHGSFILAPLLVGLAWLEDLHSRAPRARTSLAVLIASTAGTLVTPFGLGAWAYAASLATNREVTARVSEWRPTTLVDVPGVLFWASVVLVAIAVLVLWRRRPGAAPWPMVLTLIGFAGLGAVTARGIAWWSIVAVVTLASMARPLPRLDSASPLPPARTVRGSAINLGVAAALVLAGTALLPIWRPIDQGLRAPSGLLAYAPAGITAALRDLAGAEDRVWNPQVWGSWFEFAVPAPLYALDSRIEVIPPNVWADAETIAGAGKGWDRLLDDRGVTIVVIQEGEAPALSDALHASDAWALRYSDADGTVWLRLVRQ
ncbi:MAG: hypothetical protein HW391_527 [Chloroflexi bacterium]|nr:hypothetical protein [Chloroflexota bacterium]